MKRVAVISTNDNLDYLFYLPLVIEGWYKLGYDVHVFYHGKTEPLELSMDVITNLSNKYDRDTDVHFIQSIDGIDDVTLIQCARLFAGYFYRGTDTRIVTSDIDMLVVKDIFLDKGNVDVYGHDLTGFKQVPMCYVSATADRWWNMMGLDEHIDLQANMAMVIRQEPFHNSCYGHEKWATDQEILTKKLAGQFSYTHERGIEPGSFLPKGRLDRYNWVYPNSELIDVHLPRNPLNEYGKLVTLAGEWFKDYFDKFKAYKEK